MTDLDVKDMKKGEIAFVMSGEVFANNGKFWIDTSASVESTPGGSINTKIKMGQNFVTAERPADEDDPWPSEGRKRPLASYIEVRIGNI